MLLSKPSLAPAAARCPPLPSPGPSGPQPHTKMSPAWQLAEPRSACGMLVSHRRFHKEGEQDNGDDEEKVEGSSAVCGGVKRRSENKTNHHPCVFRGDEETGGICVQALGIRTVYEVLRYCGRGSFQGHKEAKGRENERKSFGNHCPCQQHRHSETHIHFTYINTYGLRRYANPRTFCECQPHAPSNSDKH